MSKPTPEELVAKWRRLLDELRASPNITDADFGYADALEDCAEQLEQALERG